MRFSYARWWCAAAAVGALALPACSGSSGGGSESVFSVRAGQCFQAPSKVKAQLSSLHHIPCSQGHTREAYAVVPYRPPTTAATAPAATYPGPDALSNFAKGACAQRFTGYVGISYLDSSLYFTYLFPSARSWEQNDDRSVVCFVTTTGRLVHSSVKGSKA